MPYSTFAPSAASTGTIRLIGAHDLIDVLFKFVEDFFKEQGKVRGTFHDMLLDLTSKNFWEAKAHLFQEVRPEDAEYYVITYPWSMQVGVLQRWLSGDYVMGRKQSLVWMDILSIKQNDPTDIAATLPLMSRIYEHSLMHQVLPGVANRAWCMYEISLHTTKRFLIDTGMYELEKDCKERGVDIAAATCDGTRPPDPKIHSLNSSYGQQFDSKEQLTAFVQASIIDKIPPFAEAQITNRADLAFIESELVKRGHSIQGFHEHVKGLVAKAVDNSKPIPFPQGVPKGDRWKFWAEHDV